MPRGFEEIAVYGDWHGRAFTGASPEVIVIAR